MGEKCANCPAEGKINIPYLSKKLCQSCFCNMIERRIRKTIRLNRLIEQQDTIAIAVSGGKDSTLLLKVLSDYAKEHRTIKLFALYIDRGDPFSQECKKAAREAARRYKVPFHSFSFKKEFGLSMIDISRITHKVGASKCSVCGVFRRRLLDEKARELGANKLATGHNLTDEAQSYLMNFVKCEWDNFLSLGPKSQPRWPGFVQRIRPLRDVPEKEIKTYVAIKGIKHFPEPCPCRAGSLRFNFMKILEELKQFRPGAEFSIVKAGDKIRKQLLKAVKGKPNKCTKCGELTSQKICRVCQYLAIAKETPEL